jgi:hypothetical protein
MWEVSMPKFDVVWSVVETVNGPGVHDDGSRDGERRIAARGQITKEAESEGAIIEALTHDLKQAFPPIGLGPTYNLDRQYDIRITAVEASGSPGDPHPATGCCACGRVQCGCDPVSGQADGRDTDPAEDSDMLEAMNPGWADSP